MLPLRVYTLRVSAVNAAKIDTIISLTERPYRECVTIEQVNASQPTLRALKSTQGQNGDVGAGVG